MLSFAFVIIGLKLEETGISILVTNVSSFSPCVFICDEASL